MASVDTLVMQTLALACHVHPGADLQPFFFALLVNRSSPAAGSVFAEQTLATASQAHARLDLHRFFFCILRQPPAGSERRVSAAMYPDQKA